MLVKKGSVEKGSTLALNKILNCKSNSYSIVHVIKTDVQSK